MHGPNEDIYCGATAGGADAEFDALGVDPLGDGGAITVTPTLADADLPRSSTTPHVTVMSPGATSSVVRAADVVVPTM